MSTKSGKGNRLELIKQLEQIAAQQAAIEAELAATKRADLRNLVDTFKQHLELGGFELQDALRLLGGRGGRGARGGAGRAAKKGRRSPARAQKAYETGVTYKNPKGDETWVGGTRGRRPPWLNAVIPDTLSYDAQVKKFKSIAK